MSDMLPWWTMIGIGVAIGVHCTVAERSEYQKINTFGRFFMLGCAALFWPVPVAAMLFLTLAAWADR